MNDDTTGFPPYPPPPERPRKSHWLRNWIVIPAACLLGLILIIGIIGIATGSSGNKAEKAPVSATAAPVSSAPASVFPSATAATSTPGDLSGPLGTTYTDDSTDQSGNKVSYDVTAVKVLDPARGSDEFETPDPGKRFVGVKFRITGDSGYASGNVNNDAVIQGSDGQAYTADFSSISAGTNFNSGDFGVTAGKTQAGWVTFQVPRGVSVAEVQWAPGLSQPATWTP